jgi:hypothetical protein
LVIERPDGARTPIPLTIWKILLRRADQAGHHYVATYQRGRAPIVGEYIERTVGERTIKWTISEIFKNPSSIAGTAVFTVRWMKPRNADRQGTEALEISQIHVRRRPDAVWWG